MRDWDKKRLAGSASITACTALHLRLILIGRGTWHRDAMHLACQTLLNIARMHTQHLGTMA
eukprot:6311732-Amphidinium_carterae.1